MSPGRTVRAGTSLLGLLALVACGGGPEQPVELVVPEGATLSQVVDTLRARGVVGSGRIFTLYARARGDDRRVKSGRYRVPAGAGWGDVLEILTEGRVVTVALTIPEGFRLTQIAPRVAEVSGVDADSVLGILVGPGLMEALGVPGPGAEGYLFPDTYRFAAGVAPLRILHELADRYKRVWTPVRRARLDSLRMTERELVTLASIVQAEARRVDEMPRIASVYHNRLREGWLLQADPTVLYALGGPRERLLFAAIDSVRDNPYNTYTQPGLPPGPVGAPGEAAIDAALRPEPSDFMYFVARPDGYHTFTRTLAEHNRAVAEARRAWSDQRARSGAGGDGGGSGGTG